MGKSGPDSQLLDWDATGFGAISAGSRFNTGLYAGNATSALFVSDGQNSRVDIGVRIKGLSEGTYDAFLTAKNTNTLTLEQYNIYSLVVDASSAATDYSKVDPLLLAHGLDAVWRNHESVIADTFQITGDQDLVLIVEGATAGEMRGFLNTLELVKLYAPLTPDVNRDGLVDLVDYELIRDNLSNQVSLGEFGDANADGLVDQKDFFLWREAYLAQGGSLATLQGLFVAEPSSFVCAIGLLPVLMQLKFHLINKPSRHAIASIASTGAAPRLAQGADSE
ncbi:MAG: hypothetical protein KDA44_10425 [Planctomycetales bacterium]|nr:hypothetical protein [Planctomycetales bacterium]